MGSFVQRSGWVAVRKKTFMSAELDCRVSCVREGENFREMLFVCAKEGKMEKLCSSHQHVTDGKIKMHSTKSARPPFVPFDFPTHPSKSSFRQSFLSSILRSFLMQQTSEGNCFSSPSSSRNMKPKVYVGVTKNIVFPFPELELLA